MPENWSQEEVEATISDYFEMLAMELRGEPFNKADHNRNLQRLLKNRTKPAIELKHQNISAVMIELGYPYIDGYKPRGNYQGLLYTLTRERLYSNIELDRTTANAVARAAKLPVVSDILSILVNPPARGDEKPRLYDRPGHLYQPPHKNYLEREASNQTLGLAGEKLVLNYEHKRLWQAGKKDLAERIEHVSTTKGDHLGYDVSSFETDGRARLIEVKTTRYGSLTPFFASRGEVEVSSSRDSEYQLYRLFHFEKQPKLFVLRGALRDSCLLEPQMFSALPR
jgi:hypothetical protein